MFGDRLRRIVGGSQLRRSGEGKSMDEIERPDGISRRRMLKRVGAGAAIAWAAPVLTSLRMPAFAAGSPAANTCDPGQGCQPACDALRQCRGGNCGCFPVGNDCWCGDLRDGFCDSFGSCATDVDCLPGERCAGSCCPTGICMPACGSGNGSGGAGTGPRLTQ